LPDNEADAWQTMKGTCRTRIRKAEKEGLVAEVTEDPSIADKFYSFYRDTLKAKGLRVSYDASCYRELFSRMSACKHLFAVSVKHEGEVIGAGFYMFDERAMYYLDSASDPAQLALCPNELLHWTAMKMAIARGIPAFNIGGGPVPSRFTTKFGGNAETYHEFSKSLNPLIHPAQVVYRAARRINKNARRAMVAVAGITLAYLITDAYAATIDHAPSDGVVVISSSATTQR
jgi:lipid II:glycine glycyltransferase (peptidoglycan interpeptide bridge formation enzyme)